jgi:hypothetical protein
MELSLDCTAPSLPTHRGEVLKSQVAPYIRISKEEMADDYPMPTQYSKVGQGG